MDATNTTAKSAMIHLVNSDVATIVATVFEKINLGEFWIGFCSWKDFRYIPAHNILNIFRAPDEDICETKSIFRFTTGCN